MTESATEQARKDRSDVTEIRLDRLRVFGKRCKMVRGEQLERMIDSRSRELDVRGSSRDWNSTGGVS